MSIAAKTREDTPNVTREPVCQNALKRQSEIRRERLQGIVEGASSAPRLASSSAASFPGRNKCSGTHCSLIEQEREDRSATEFEIRGKKEKRREMADLLVLPRPAKSVQTSAEKLEHTRPTEKERVASVPERESSWQERHSRPCQKKKEQSCLFRVPNHERERVKMGQREGGGSEREHGEERMDSTVKEGRFQGGQARRASLEQVEGSMSG